jgi:hypothetical protein
MEGNEEGLTRLVGVCRLRAKVGCWQEQAIELHHELVRDDTGGGAQVSKKQK